MLPADRPQPWPGARIDVIFAAGVLLYLAAFLYARLAMTGTIAVDDVEQTLYAQSWQLSYYPGEPPLFTWLLYGLFNTIGVSAFSVLVLRYTLLGLTYVFLYASMRRLLRDPPLAAIAAGSIVAVYYIGWGEHTGFTHTNLMLTCMMATTYVTLRLFEDGGLGNYVWLGVAVGAGLISKYNYLLVCGGWCAAGLLQPVTRARLLDRRILLSVAIALAIGFPSVTWLLAAANPVHSVHQTVLHQPSRHFPGPWPSLQKLMVQSLAFLFPFFPFGLALLPQALLPRRTPTAPGYDAPLLVAHYLLITWVTIALLVVSGVLLFHKARWLHPALLLIPPYVVWRAVANGAQRRQIRLFGAVLGALAVAVLAIWIAQPVLGPPLLRHPICGRCRMFAPFDGVAADIAAAGFRGGTIVAGDEHLGGNLRLAFPHARVLTPVYDIEARPARPPAGQCLLAWTVGRGRTALPGAVRAFLREQLHGDVKALPALAFSRHPNRAAATRPLVVGYIVMPGGTGECR